MSHTPRDGEFWKNCSSGICSRLEMYKGKGRPYIVRTWHEGIEREWCPTCIRINGEVKMQSDGVATMIREEYKMFIEDPNKHLTKSSGELLTEFVQHICRILGNEL